MSLRVQSIRLERHARLGTLRRTRRGSCRRRNGRGSAVAPTGGTPETIDSFSWTGWMPISPGFDACPQVIADGVAVYWTHGGALMRLCE
jgi:hypothetical protein